MGILDQLKRMLTGEGSAPPSFSALDRSAHAAVTVPVAPRVELVPRHAHMEDVEVTSEFRLVLTLLEENAPFILVMGQAGTGKTTLIRWLAERVTSKSAIVAPTGIAALTAGGQTIHSFFRLPPGPPDAAHIRRPRDPALFRNLELLVIDEISMVPCDLLDVIDGILRHHRPDRSHEPFGGVQIVAVGDLYQLPPVITDPERSAKIERQYRSPHFFSAEALRDTMPATVELTRPFRQTDATFLVLLRSIREDRDTDRAIEQFNGACFDPIFDDPGWPVAVPTRRQALEINSSRLSALTGPTHTYTGELTGEFLPKQQRAGSPPRLVDDSALPAPLELTLRPGARAIFTKNDRAHRWVNGTLGTVIEVLPDCVRVRLDGDSVGLVHEVRSETWEKYKYVYDADTDRLVPTVVGAFRQLPLMLAWALTIHKLQGQTVSQMIVDLGTGTFAAGQTYVALSRCRSLETLKLRRRLNRSEVRTDPQIRAFMDSIRPYLANRVLSADPPSG